jgi:hypothetical protein
MSELLVRIEQYIEGSPVLYRIVVTFDNTTSTLDKRFSEFEGLHGSLASKTRSKLNKPKKGLRVNLKDRRVELERFLIAAISASAMRKSDNAAIDKFLQIDRGRLGDSIVSLSDIRGSELRDSDLSPVRGSDPSPNVDPILSGELAAAAAPDQAPAPLQDAEDLARQEAEERERRDQAEERARREQAEELARQDAEKRARQEAEENSKREQAEESARQEAEGRARREQAEESARQEAEERSRREQAEERLRQEAIAKASEMKEEEEEEKAAEQAEVVSRKTKRSIGGVMGKMFRKSVDASPSTAPAPRRTDFQTVETPLHEVEQDFEQPPTVMMSLAEAQAAVGASAGAGTGSRDFQTFAPEEGGEEGDEEGDEEPELSMGASAPRVVKQQPPQKLEVQQQQQQQQQQQNAPKKATISRSTTDVAASNQMEIQTQLTTGFERIWWNKSSASAQTDGELSVWRPQAPDGCVSLGDMLVRGYNEPNYTTCIMDDKTGIVVKPEGYMLLFGQKRDSRGVSPGSKLLHIWKPIAPAGYRVLGVVVSMEDEERGDRPSLPGRGEKKTHSAHRTAKKVVKKVVVVAGQYKDKKGKFVVPKGEATPKQVHVKVDGQSEASIYSIEELRMDAKVKPKSSWDGDVAEVQYAAGDAVEVHFPIDLSSANPIDEWKPGVVEEVVEVQIDSSKTYEVKISGRMCKIRGSDLAIDLPKDELKLIYCVRQTFCIPCTVKEGLLLNSIADSATDMPHFPLSGNAIDEDDFAEGMSPLWPMSFFTVKNQCSTFICQLGDSEPAEKSLILFNFVVSPMKKERKEHLSSRRVADFDLIWSNKTTLASPTDARARSDSGAGAPYNSIERIAIWKPRSPEGEPGCKVLGHVFSKDWNEPSVALVARPGADVKRPTSYGLVWRNNGKAMDASKNDPNSTLRQVSIWAPKAPPGYVVLGYIAVASWKTPIHHPNEELADPPEATIWCVPEDCVEFSSFSLVSEKAKYREENDREIRYARNPPRNSQTKERE